MTGLDRAARRWPSAGRVNGAVAACGVLLLAVPLLSVAPATAAQTGSDVRQVIVQLAPRADVAGFAAAESRRGGRVGATFTRAMNGFAAALSSSRIDALRADPMVLSVVPDGELHALDVEANPPWGLDRLDQRASLLDQAYTYDSTGSGVTAFVVDTGIRATHTEFTGRVLPGHDFVDNDNDPDDCNGHGTHVAGTIGGTTYGVAKDVDLVSLRVLGCDGSGSDSDSIAAFDWIIAHRPAGPAVVNFSVGGPTDTLIDQAVERVVAAGIPVSVAAGNDHVDACGGSPARTPGALTVAASDQTDARASFSDFGPCVDVFAPGVVVRSAWIGADDATMLESGTSMATPHVSGAVARFLETHPAATPAEVADWVQTASTHGIVTQSLSSNNNLLYIGSEPQPPPVEQPPPVVAPPPVVITQPTVSGAVTPATVVVDGSPSKAYTVSVTSTAPLESRLSATVSTGTTSEFLLFDNPSGDRTHWTASGQVFPSQPRGFRVVTGFSALWREPSGSLTNATLTSAAPITFDVVDAVPSTPPVLTSTTPPSLVGKVRIAFVRWDARGPDTAANASVNGEFVRLVNTTGRAVTLTGGTLRDQQGHAFVFPRTVLAAHSGLRVYTGRGRATATKRYWGLRHPVWGNSHDVATLLDGRHTQVDRVRWRARGRGFRSFP